MDQTSPISRRTRAFLRGNLIGFVALFIALTMGTAQATHPGGADTISSEDIIDGEVKTRDVDNNGVRSEDIRDDTLGAVDLGAASVGSSELAPDAVGSASIQDLAIQAGDLADGAVNNAKLNFFAVSSSKIAPNAVSSSTKIADGVVGDADIATDAVGGRALKSLVTRTATVTVNGGALAPEVATVACNADEVVIGGGADWQFTSYSTRIIENRRSGNGWRVEGYYGDGPNLAEDPPSVNLEVEAYCLAL